MNFRIKYREAILRASQVTGIHSSEWLTRDRSIQATRLRWALWYQLKQIGWRPSEIAFAAKYKHKTITHGLKQMEFIIFHPTNYELEKQAAKIATDKLIKKEIENL
jgi:hypothetical protein